MIPEEDQLIEVNFGGGLYSADLPSAIPENYCSECLNAVPTGTSVENRFGITKASVGFKESEIDVDQINQSFTYLGPSGSPNHPIMIWGAKLDSGLEELHLLREGNPFDDPGGDLVADGYFSSIVNRNFQGSVKYGTRIYIFFDDGVTFLSDLNWSTPSLTLTTVSGAPTVISSEPIHFFDRLWVAGGSKLYYTEPPTSSGAFPGTWNTVTNFITVVGAQGPGKIYKLIPLGSKIFIFTSQGLFSLTVYGTPSQWYLRSIDENAIVNSNQCAFEYNGLIYYISIYGVFVTDGTDSIKLSGPIENFFLAGNFEQGATSPTKRSNIYRISFMDGGLIASISNYFLVGSTVRYDSENCHNFYTRLANIAWSEWQFNSPDGDTKLAAVTTVADAVESYVNKNPLSYMMVQTTASTRASAKATGQELMTYDGLQDTWTLPTGHTGTTSANISTRFKTRYFEGRSLIHLKKFKYAYLNIYTSDKTKLTNATAWNYQWDTENLTKLVNGSEITSLDISSISGLEFNSIKLHSDFPYRMCQLTVILNTENTQSFKIRNLVAVQKTIDTNPEAVS